MSSLRKDDIHCLTNEEEIGTYVSNQFRRFFITYSMAINKQENRIGNFFDRSFKRLEITDQEYLEYAIFYVHHNPEKYGLIDDFRKYRYSSYSAFISDKSSRISRNEVLEILGGKMEFLNYHDILHEERENVVLE